MNIFREFVNFIVKHKILLFGLEERAQNKMPVKVINKKKLKLSSSLAIVRSVIQFLYIIYIVNSLFSLVKIWLNLEKLQDKHIWYGYNSNFM